MSDVKNNSKQFNKTIVHSYSSLMEGSKVYSKVCKVCI